MNRNIHKININNKQYSHNVERDGIHSFFMDRKDKICYKIREVCGKSKWKFKMAFAMKGGGSRGGLQCHIPILKNDFC